MKILSLLKQFPVLRLFTDTETNAALNLFILGFFTFMGTSLPFQERIIDAYEAETTNIVNQIVYTFLFLASFIIIIRNPKAISTFIRKEKYLSIFILFCFISFLWSDYSLISFKRSFQLVVTFITLLNTVLFVRLKYIITILKILSYIYVLITYFSGFLIPQAIDTGFGTWRGIELHKNLLGHTSLMIVTLGVYFYYEAKNKLSKYSSLLLILLSTLLILLSGSSTNTIGFIAIFIILMIIYMDKYFLPLGIGRFFSSLLVTIIILSSIILSIYSTEILSIIPGLFGKNLSFTGRDLIWIYIWNEIQKKFWLGYGYGTYWIMGTSVIDIFQSYVGWRVNEAHNGFLEIMLQTGIIGFTFFISLLISFVHKIIKTDSIIALLALVSITVVNFSESFLFESRSLSTLVFIFFYLFVSRSYFNVSVNDKE